MAESEGQKPDFYAFPIDRNGSRSVRILYDRLENKSMKVGFFFFFFFRLLQKLTTFTSFVQL